MLIKLYNFKYHVLKLLKIRWDWICHDLWQGLFLLNGTCIFFYPQAFGILEKRRTKVNDKVWMNNILIVILYFIVLFLWPQTSCESWIRFHEQSSIYASYRQEILLITFNFPYTYLIIWDGFVQYTENWQHDIDSLYTCSILSCTFA